MGQNSVTDATQSLSTLRTTGVPELLPQTPHYYQAGTGSVISTPLNKNLLHTCLATHLPNPRGYTKYDN